MATKDTLERENRILRAAIGDLIQGHRDLARYLESDKFTANYPANFQVNPSDVMLRLEENSNETLARLACQGVSI